MQRAKNICTAFAVLSRKATEGDRIEVCSIIAVTQLICKMYDKGKKCTVLPK